MGVFGGGVEGGRGGGGGNSAATVSQGGTTGGAVEPGDAAWTIVCVTRARRAGWEVWCCFIRSDPLGLVDPLPGGGGVPPSAQHA
jgi:hypothetical protein